MDTTAKIPKLKFFKFLSYCIFYFVRIASFILFTTTLVSSCYLYPSPIIEWNSQEAYMDELKITTEARCTNGLIKVETNLRPILLSLLVDETLLNKDSKKTIEDGIMKVMNMALSDHRVGIQLGIYANAYCDNIVKFTMSGNSSGSSSKKFTQELINYLKKRDKELYEKIAATKADPTLVNATINATINFKQEGYTPGFPVWEFSLSSIWMHESLLRIDNKRKVEDLVMEAINLSLHQAMREQLKLYMLALQELLHIIKKGGHIDKITRQPKDVRY